MTHPEAVILIEETAKHIIEMKTNPCEEVAFFINQICHFSLYGNRSHVGDLSVYDKPIDQKRLKVYENIIKLSDYSKHPQYEMSSISFVIEKMIKECFSRIDYSFDNRAYLLGLIDHIKNHSLKSEEPKKMYIFGVLTLIQNRIEKLL